MESASATVTPGMGGVVAVVAFVVLAVAPGAAHAEVGVSGGSASEGSQVGFVISTTSPLETVSYSTAAGTATADSDFTPPPAGASVTVTSLTPATVLVSTIQDAVAEPDETFTLVGTGADRTATATGTVLNDDAPAIQAADVSVLEPDDGATTVTFTVRLGAPTTQTVTVDYSTQDSTATAPADYAPTSGVLTFQPGEVEHQVPVTVNGDRLGEGDETFALELLNAVNATPPPAPPRATIVDDDPLPVAGIELASTREGTGTITPLTFTVTLDRPPEQAVSVGWSTFDDTARRPATTPPCATPACSSRPARRAAR